MFIGTSRWSYHHRHGVLYPHGPRPAERLVHCVEAFDNVERDVFACFGDDAAGNAVRYEQTPREFVAQRSR